MASKTVIECVDSLLRYIMHTDLPFGNKTFLALGNFRQVAPVLRDITAPAAVFDSSIRSSSLWKHFQILQPTQPIHNAGDSTYADWVDQIGYGIPPFDKTVLKGLVKNARVRILELHRHIVQVGLLHFYLPRINFDFRPEHTSWTVERRQFPSVLLT